MGRGPAEDLDAAPRVPLAFGGQLNVSAEPGAWEAARRVSVPHTFWLSQRGGLANAQRLIRNRALTPS